MKMKIIDKYPITTYDGVNYNYTIDTLHFGILNLIHFAAILNVEITQALGMIRNLRGYVYNLNGYIYFRNREDAGNLLRLLKEHREDLN